MEGCCVNEIKEMEHPFKSSPVNAGISTRLWNHHPIRYCPENKLSHFRRPCWNIFLSLGCKKLLRSLQSGLTGGLIESREGVLVNKKAQGCRSATKKPRSFLFLCRLGDLCHLYAPSQCCQKRTLPLVLWNTSSGNTGDNEGPAPHFEPREPLAEKDVRATSTPRIYYYCCLFPLSFPLQLRTTCSTEKNISPRRPLRHWFWKTEHRVGVCDSGEGLSR